MKFFKRLYLYFFYRFHPNHQYHKLSTGLSPRYYDLDKRMLYAIMNEFVNFLEDNDSYYFNIHRHPERAADINHVNKDEHHFESLAIRKEFEKVYKFWKDEYLLFYKNKPAYFTNAGTMGKYILAEDDLEKKATEMAIIVIKNRECLWS